MGGAPPSPPDGERGSAPPVPPPAGPPYYPYPPQPKRNNVVLIVVIVVVLAVAIPTALAAVLYVMVSGLMQNPNPPGAARPVFIFVMPVAVSGGVATVRIASTSQALTRDNYKVNLLVNTTTGTAAALAAAGTATNVVVSGVTYTVTWNNIGGTGKVVGGDSFAITKANGLPTFTSFTFYLIWSDGTAIGQISWNT